MSSSERILGELIEFRKQAGQRQDRFEEQYQTDMSEIKRRLTTQEQFRWKFVGACLAFNGAVVIICEVGRAMLHSSP